MKSKLTFLFLIVLLMRAVSVFALYPEDKEEARKSAQELQNKFEDLFKDFSPYFSGEKKPKLSGEEELGWRIHDFLEDAGTLNGMIASYYENEKKIDTLLVRMNDHTRWIDEAFMYTPVADKIKKKWIRTRDFYRRLENMLKNKVEHAAGAAEGGLKFKVSKVNKLDKKYVLRELLNNFLGSSELDKFPFPEEKKSLDPEEVGEHYIVTWECGGVKRFDKPLIMRFEYKFNDRKFDGFIEETYRDIKSGSYQYTFKNIGAEFGKRGQIIHWRAVVIFENKIVAEKKSPMWSIVAR